MSDSLSKPELKKVEIVDGKINFACLREECPNSCCGPFGGVQHGISSVTGREFSEIILTPDDAPRITDAGYSDFTERGEDGFYRMRLLADGTCSAFKNGRCSIHPVKPTVCRAFPFYVDMFVGLCGVTSCPGFGAGWTDLDRLRSEFEAARRMYTFWLESLRVQGGTQEQPVNPFRIIPGDGQR